MAAFEFQKWSVSRRAKAPLLDFVLDGLKAAGCRILFASDPSHAPFLITYETRQGEREGVLVYAFFANSKVTKNRPPDEHRFQVKYGGDDKAILPIEFDPAQLITTIFVGIDPERGIMVGAAPDLHDKTPMYLSMEFKRHHADEIRLKGWNAWERTSWRTLGDPVEVLVGVSKERVYDYIRFERLALGFDAGHRQLLAEKVMSRPAAVAGAAADHALIYELGLSEVELLDLIQGARRLKMAVRGWVAEIHLENFLRAVPGVEECERMDEEGQPDIALRFRGSRRFYIECKNVLRTKTADGSARVDFQRTRASKADPCSRYYQPSDFTVLAACLHAVTLDWEYRFIATSRLPKHSKCDGKLQSNLRIGEGWSADPVQVLTEVTSLL
jgi:hypothetical protein